MADHTDEQGAGGAVLRCKTCGKKGSPLCAECADPTPLKPCPYCGGEAEKRAVSIGAEVRYGYYCKRTRCQYGQNHSPAAWNTRPLEDALQAQLRERDEMLREVMELLDRAYRVTPPCCRDEWARRKSNLQARYRAMEGLQ